MNIEGSVKQSINDTNKNKKSRQTQDEMSPKKRQTHQSKPLLISTVF